MITKKAISRMAMSEKVDIHNGAPASHSGHSFLGFTGVSGGAVSRSLTALSFLH